MVGEIIKNRSKIVIIGKGTEQINKKEGIRFFCDDANFNDELVESFINIPVFQLLAYIKTLKLGLDPDNPKGLDYTTKLSI